MYIRARDAVRLTFEVPISLHRELQLFAAQNNLFMKDCVIDAIEIILKNKKKFLNKVDNVRELLDD